eukprot:scaffold306012_cov36-Tisochrysis_lutea.AAC.1
MPKRLAAGRVSPTANRACVSASPVFAQPSHVPYEESMRVDCNVLHLRCCHFDKNSFLMLNGRARGVRGGRGGGCTPAELERGKNKKWAPFA